LAIDVGALEQEGGFTVDFMPYEGAPRQRGHDSERLVLALAIGAALIGGAWRLGAFDPASSPRWSSSRSAPSATAADTVSANGNVASQDLVKHPVAAH
jgi:hypothetical protein